MKLNEGPLAVELFLIGRGTHSLILAVRQHHARLHIVAQVRGEHDILQITLGLRIIDRRHNLYAAIKIAMHPVRAAYENLFVAAVGKVIDAAVLKKATDDASDTNRFR